jgi:trimethylamine corrinoid protein
MSKTFDLQSIVDAILAFDAPEAAHLAQAALAAGVPPLMIVENGLSKGLKRIGESFECGDTFLPELIAAARAAQSAMEVVQPALRAENKERKPLGRFVVGTVQGDIHDIGKNIVCALAQANGFEVIDLGVDVPTDTFIANVRDLRPQILGLSAMLTTTQRRMPEVIQALRDADLRSAVRVIVGGAPVNREWSRIIGADAYGADAPSAMNTMRDMVER